MSLGFRPRLMQAFIAVSFLAGAWTMAVLLTGGFVVELGAWRISSRSAFNPAIATLLAALTAYGLATVEDRRRVWPTLLSFARGEPSVLAHRLAVAVALAAALSATSFGLARGLFVAAAADAYGYVSQADLWARGELIVRQPWAYDMTWPNADDALAPLGYRPHRPAAHGTDIVPIYSPGVPMLMAAFKLLGGPRAVYYVVPLLGGLAVWITFLLGRRLAGPFVGTAASLLLATSPTFLFEVTAPASDIAATAWWSLALYALMFESRMAALGAGLATGIGILTRPNVAPLALVMAAPIVWRMVRSSSIEAKRHALTRLLFFGLGVIPACGLIGVLNWTLYGSPLSSGYGSLDALYRWSHGSANLVRYPRWLIETQTPVVLMAAVAPFLLPRSGVVSPRSAAIFWLASIVTIFGLYLFYLPFDEWWYLRFLMPMFPALFVLTSATLFFLSALAQRVVPNVGGLVAAGVVTALAWHGVSLALDRGAAHVWEAEQRYAEAGAYVTSALPERAALISMQHSGSARFYSGRITVRYDAIGSGDLGRVLTALRQLGYRPYFLLDDWEEANFRSRFSGASPLGRLDWAPKAHIHRRTVRLYDPEERRP